MESLLVSVIIPLYNAELYIEDCINSVLSQTYKNVEIIIVDDGSTDKSLSIARSFEKTGNVVVYTQKNKGAAAARNKGLLHANGDYIQFLDADDILCVDKIKEQMNLANTFGFNQKYALFCSWKMMNSNNKIDERVCKTYESPIDILLDLMRYGTMILPHCYLLPIGIIKKTGLWDESFSRNDDGEWFARILSNSDKLIFCERTYVLYRDTPNSLSKSQSVNAMLSEIWAYISIAEHARKCHSADVDDVIFNFILNKIMYYYPYYKEYRHVGESYLHFRNPNRIIKTPKIGIKTRLYYLGVKFGLIKGNLPL